VTGQKTFRYRKFDQPQHRKAGSEDPVEETTLGFGAPLPDVGTILQRNPTKRSGTMQANFRKALEDAGYKGWANRQAEHITDLEFAGQDKFTNLWPADTSANLHAGLAHTHQRVWARLKPDSDPEALPINYPDLAGRFFRIYDVRRFLDVKQTPEGHQGEDSHDAGT
jgi:hypothetical protein